jgi:EpsI family protein
MPAPPNGWVMASPAMPPFRPHFIGAKHTLERTFERGGRTVGLFIAYYADQREGTELIAAKNSIIAPRNRSWIQISRSSVSESSSDLDVVQTQLRGANNDMTTWHWYWAGGRWTTRPEIVKALQAFDKLLGRGDESAVIVLYIQSDIGRASANDVLREFYVDMVPTLGSVLSEVRRRARTPGPPPHSKL